MHGHLNFKLSYMKLGKVHFPLPLMLNHTRWASEPLDVSKVPAWRNKLRFHVLPV